MGEVTHWKRGLRFEKQQLVEFPPRKKKVDFQSWARPDNFVRYGRRALVGLRADDVKAVSIEKFSLSLSLSLSLLTSKNSFTQKVIKRFVPELRSQKVLYFGFPMSISHIRIMGMLHEDNISKALNE